MKDNSPILGYAYYDEDCYCYGIGNADKVRGNFLYNMLKEKIENEEALKKQTELVIKNDILK